MDESKELTRMKSGPFRRTAPRILKFATQIWIDHSHSFKMNRLSAIRSKRSPQNYQNTAARWRRAKTLETQLSRETAHKRNVTRSLSSQQKHNSQLHFPRRSKIALGTKQVPIGMEYTS